MVVKVGFSFSRMKEVEWSNLGKLEDISLAATYIFFSFCSDSFLLLLESSGSQPGHFCLPYPPGPGDIW